MGTLLRAVIRAQGKRPLCLVTLGGSHCTTRSTSGMSRPRAATSVATRQRNFPSRNPCTRKQQNPYALYGMTFKRAVIGRFQARGFLVNITKFHEREAVRCMSCRGHQFNAANGTQTNSIELNIYSVAQ